MNRRDFLSRSAAAAGLAAAATATNLPALAQAPATTDAEAAEVEAKVARILALYGSRMSPEQQRRMRSTVAGHVTMLQAVRAEALVNSEPPATVLRLVNGTGAQHG
ncbi:MAG TPA: twin-arginine translocation signal domain-containing protein [Terriglobales bacterium]|nr:twin-arginine translocation signal domain-containing protein [Terriglobales bacterium]